MESIPKPSNRLQIIGLAIIILQSVVIGLLIMQNHDLKNAMGGGSGMPALQPGEHLEPVTIQAVDGTVKELSYSDSTKKYLVMVLSTTCPHCEKNLENWKEIVDNNTNNGGCSVIGLCIHSIGETVKFVASKHVNFAIASVASDTSFNRKYKISGVPETILVGGGGIVEKTWLGELSSDQTKEIQKLMRGSKPLTN